MRFQVFPVGEITHNAPCTMTFAISVTHHFQDAHKQNNSQKPGNGIHHFRASSKLILMKCRKKSTSYGQENRNPMKMRFMRSNKHSGSDFSTT